MSQGIRLEMCRQLQFEGWVALELWHNPNRSADGPTFPWTGVLPVLFPPVVRSRERATGFP